MAVVEAIDRFRLDNLRVVSFKAPASLIELMNRAAKRLGINRSELIRDAVYAYIAIHTPELIYEELGELGEWLRSASSGAASSRA